LPRAQSEDAEIFVFRSDSDPGTALAAEVDAGKLIKCVKLPWQVVGKFVDTNLPADLAAPPFKVEVDAKQSPPPTSQAREVEPYAIKTECGPRPVAALRAR